MFHEINFNNLGIINVKIVVRDNTYLKSVARYVIMSYLPTKVADYTYSRIRSVRKKFKLIFTY